MVYNLYKGSKMNITLDTLVNSVCAINGKTINVIIANNELSKQLPCADGPIKYHTELKQAFDLLGLKEDDLFVWMDISVKEKLGDLFEKCLLVNSVGIEKPTEESIQNNKENMAERLKLVSKEDILQITKIIVDALINSDSVSVSKEDAEKIKVDLYNDFKNKLDNA